MFYNLKAFFSCFSSKIVSFRKKISSFRESDDFLKIILLVDINEFNESNDIWQKINIIIKRSQVQCPVKVFFLLTFLEKSL